MKGVVGSSDADKELIYDNIRESIIEIATIEIGYPHEEQQQQQQQQQNQKKGWHSKKSNSNLLQKMAYLMR